MKTIKIFVAALLLLSFIPQGKKKLTLYIIGDSTAANKAADKYPETGWGMKFQQFFDSNNVVVDNRALNGRSTLSFRNEGRWQPIFDSLQPGDYVLIQFGHNDEKIDKPGTGVDHAGFNANLARYVTETRAKNGIPVLLTPIARRSFKDGKLQDTHKGYPDVVRNVADSMQVPLIDMEQNTKWLLTALGPDLSKKLFLYVDSGNVYYPQGKKDDTHLNEDGAAEVAAMVAGGLTTAKLDIAKYRLPGK